MIEHGTLPPDRPPRTRQPGAPDLARWVEDRLCETSGRASAAVYGLELIDPGALVGLAACARPSGGPAASAARLTFLAAAADAGALVVGPAGAAACEFDAAVLAVTQWPPAVCPVPRPGEHLVRRRARVVVLVAEEGVATATRFDHDPDHVVLSRGLAWAGVAGIQLAATWGRVRG